MDVCRLLPLTGCAPDIVEAIMGGRQPSGSGREVLDGRLERDELRPEVASRAFCREDRRAHLGLIGRSDVQVVSP